MQLKEFLTEKVKKSGTLVKAVSLLASGSMLGQVVGFIGSMFMTRMYTKEAIGIMTLVTAVTGMFAAVVNGRFDYAIVKEDDEKMVYPLIKLAMITGLILSGAVAVGSFPYFLSKSENISPWVAILFVFLILAITGFTNIFRSYNNRVADYKTMTYVIVIRKLAEDISMIGFGLLKLGYLALLVSRVIGQFFGMRRQTRNIRGLLPEILRTENAKVRQVFQKHKKQLYFSAPAQLLNSASYSILSIFVEALFGLASLAVYGISVQVLGLPLSVISSNVSKVYFGEASKEFAKTGQFRNSTKKILFILLPLSVVVFIGMYWVIPLLVPIVYGEGFRGAGVYIRLLAPMFAVRFITSSMTTGLVVANKQQQEMLLQFGFFGSAVLVFALSKAFAFPVERFLLGITITYSLIYLVFLAVIYYQSGKRQPVPAAAEEETAEETTET